MNFLTYLSITMFILWCVSEIAITIINLINRITVSSHRSDKFSFAVVWLLTIPGIFLAFIIQNHSILTNGIGNLSILSIFLGYCGCLFIGAGVTIRLLAVAMLKRQFTTVVSIGETHQLIEEGIYKHIRHPSYLGFLTSMFGIGLILGNWISMVILVVFPFLGIFYRIRVEESALLIHFGSTYQEYVNRTKRLIPGIW
jgi:protein-S-isoprenylcysteine O-methyltransferase Ste14